MTAKPLRFLLAETLADLYSDEQEIDRIATGAGVSRGQVPHHPKAITAWHELLGGLDAAALGKIVDRAKEEYPKKPWGDFDPLRKEQAPAGTAGTSSATLHLSWAGGPSKRRWLVAPRGDTRALLATAEVHTDGGQPPPPTVSMRARTLLFGRWEEPRDLGAMSDNPDPHPDVSLWSKAMFPRAHKWRTRQIEVTIATGDEKRSERALLIPSLTSGVALAVAVAALALAGFFLRHRFPSLPADSAVYALVGPLLAVIARPVWERLSSGVTPPLLGFGDILERTLPVGLVLVAIAFVARARPHHETPIVHVCPPVFWEEIDAAAVVGKPAGAQVADGRVSLALDPTTCQPAGPATAVVKASSLARAGSVTGTVELTYPAPKDWRPLSIEPVEQRYEVTLPGWNVEVAPNTAVTLLAPTGALMLRFPELNATLRCDSPKDATGLGRIDLTPAATPRALTLLTESTKAEIAQWNGAAPAAMAWLCGCPEPHCALALRAEGAPGATITLPPELKIDRVKAPGFDGTEVLLFCFDKQEPRTIRFLAEPAEPIFNQRLSVFVALDTENVSILGIAPGLGIVCNPPAGRIAVRVQGRKAWLDEKSLTWDVVSTRTRTCTFKNGETNDAPKETAGACPSDSSEITGEVAGDRLFDKWKQCRRICCQPQGATCGQ